MPHGSVNSSLVAAAILADAIARVAARVWAAGQARGAGGWVGEAAVATSLAVIDRGAGAGVRAEPFAAVRAGRSLRARGWAGIASAVAGHATVAGGAATIAAANEAIDASRIITTGTTKSGAAISSGIAGLQPRTSRRQQAGSQQSPQGCTPRLHPRHLPGPPVERYRIHRVLPCRLTPSTNRLERIIERARGRTLFRALTQAACFRPGNILSPRVRSR
jgi:hypothetical protein